MTKKLPPLEMPTMVMAIMKCCNRATHTSKCARYWHTRQREEVRKRVAGEKAAAEEMMSQATKHLDELQKFTASANKTFLDVAHEMALAYEAMREAYGAVKDGSELMAEAILSEAAPWLLK